MKVILNTTYSVFTIPSLNSVSLYPICSFLKTCNVNIYPSEERLKLDYKAKYRKYSKPLSPLSCSWREHSPLSGPPPKMNVVFIYVVLFIWYTLLCYSFMPSHAAPDKLYWIQIHKKICIPVASSEPLLFSSPPKSTG